MKHWEIKCLKTFLRLIVGSSMKTIYRLSLSDVEMLLLTGSCYVGNFICLHDRRNSHYFYQTWDLTHGQNSSILGLLHFFSALKDKTLKSDKASHYLRPVPDKR